MNEQIIDPRKYDNVSASEAMTMMIAANNEVTRVLRQPFGTGWGYDIKEITDSYMILTIKYSVNGVSFRQDVLGGSIPLILEHFAELYERANPRQETSQPKETYTPTAYDMEQMTDFFMKHQALYKERFARQISQSEPPFGMLTEEQRIRLCIIWKRYMQTINND